MKDNTVFTSESGFTLIELLLTIGIAAILVSFISINLLKAQHTTSIATAMDTLLADMKSQQVKAMNGSSINGTSGDSYGITFNTHQYILFHGTSDPGDGTDFPVAVDGITISTTLPSNLLVFSQQSGEVANFVNGSNTITLQNSAGSEQETLTINKYGTVTNIH